MVSLLNVYVHAFVNRYLVRRKRNIVHTWKVFHQNGSRHARLRATDVVNVNLHCLQPKYFTPECLSVCLLRFSPSASLSIQNFYRWRTFLQNVFVCAFSSCSFVCLSSEQANGFSSAWISLRVFRALACVKKKLHCGQIKGFSPVWTRMCLFKSMSLLPLKLHWLQQVWDEPYSLLKLNYELFYEIKLFSRKWK